jgi:hypothetical protein
MCCLIDSVVAAPGIAETWGVTLGVDALRQGLLPDRELKARDIGQSKLSGACEGFSG